MFRIQNEFTFYICISIILFINSNRCFYILQYTKGYCKDRIWIPDPTNEQAQAQKAQNNKFIESVLENWAIMSWMANKVDSNYKNRKIDGFQLKKVVIGQVQGDQFLYLYLNYNYKFIFWLL